MIGKSIPKYLTVTVTLALLTVGLMSGVFYVQYRSLTQELVDTSTAHFDAAQAASFERRARSRMHRIADAIVLHGNTGGKADLAAVLQAALTGSEDLNGLSFEYANGDILAVDDGGESAREGNGLVLSYEVVDSDVRLGSVTGTFALNSAAAETAAFEQTLLLQNVEQRIATLQRIVLTALVSVLFCGTVIWLLVRNQSRRISELRVQAEKLSRSNFGEPLKPAKNDELGQLARVFNNMREELQNTTVSRDYMDNILSGMNEAIIVTDDAGSISRINDATTKMLGFEEDELLGARIDKIFESTKSGSLQTGHDGGIPDEAKLVSKTGELIPVSYTGSEISAGDDRPGSRIYAAQNITERRKAEKRIRYLARIDPLTKVPNRMQFQHLLQRAIARAKRSGTSIALFYVDVDYFKEINDTFGHLAGDTTLETVATRLTETLPDDCVIGRLAGDEFAVIVDRLQPSEETARHLDQIARQLLAKLAEPFYVQGHEVFMTASMGIACCPEDAANVIDLIRNADAALYHAKKRGGNVSAYYKPEMNHTAVERLMTKSKLKRAFERDELLVRYHPRYNIETGEVVGAEALVRWDLPERGIILPADFIPLAEETNLIVEIGEWVLDRVCADFRYWQESITSPGRVSVNLSLKQLRQSNFINRISGILRSYELSPTSLELEITETTLMENPVRTVKILDELYSLGLHLAIDDFGTGYSSLSALQQFPISTLKIDKSFVRDVAVNPDDATIVGTIINMGQSLNMEVVAEGVESEDQLGFLQNLGCAFVQGMLFGEPMSSEEYLKLVLSQAEGTDKYRALFA